MLLKGAGTWFLLGDPHLPGGKVWNISAAQFAAFPVPVHTSLEQAGQLHRLDAPGEESRTLSLTPTTHMAFAQLHVESFCSHTWQNPPT